MMKRSIGASGAVDDTGARQPPDGDGAPLPWGLIMRSRWICAFCAIAVLAALLLGPAGAAWSQDNNAEDMMAAACIRKITPVVGVNHPDPNIWMAGFDNGRAATGVHDDLWARGVVIKSRGKTVAIVVLDLIGYFINEVETIRGLVDPAHDFDYIQVSSTHTHEGPDTMGLWGQTEVVAGIDPAYNDWIDQTVADCIDEAADSLVPAKVRYATTTTEGASLPPNEDLVADGKVLAGDGGQIINPVVPVMQIVTRDGSSTIATIVNFASHPESLGSGNTLISSDFPHYMREAVEAELGGVAIYMSADLGVLQGPLDVDVLDPATNMPAQRRTFRFAEVMGNLLAERALKALSRTQEYDSKPVIEIQTVSPIDIRLDNPFFKFFGAIGVLPRRPLYTNGTVDPGVTLDPIFGQIPLVTAHDVRTEAHVMRIGQANFVSTPNELDPQIGFKYKDLMTKAKHKFITGLSNDEIGYQVPADKWDNSCHQCALFILAGVPQFCPAYPNIDCNTVFSNNVGQNEDEVLRPLVSDMIKTINADNGTE